MQNRHHHCLCIQYRRHVLPRVGILRDAFIVITITNAEVTLPGRPEHTHTHTLWRYLILRLINVSVVCVCVDGWGNPRSRNICMWTRSSIHRGAARIGGPENNNKKRVRYTKINRHLPPSLFFSFGGNFRLADVPIDVYRCAIGNRCFGGCHTHTHTHDNL